jgi:hypothetical protein
MPKKFIKLDWVDLFFSMAGLQLQEKYTIHKYIFMYMEQLNSLNYFFDRIPNFFGGFDWFWIIWSASKDTLLWLLPFFVNSPSCLFLVGYDHERW